MQKPFIAGIQQIGIGIPDVYAAWQQYRALFTQDIPIFDEAATAALMLPYTGGQPQSRHAVLAINANGGGGFEIWQYTGRTPQAPTFEPQLGDLGIFVTKIKSKDVRATYAAYEKSNVILLSAPTPSPEGTHKEHFFIKDTYNNIFEITASDNWFADSQGTTGGAFGAILGVSDIEKARTLYSNILGYDEVVYDIEGAFTDFEGLPGGKKETFRRVLLRHSQARVGAFSQLLGKSEIELVQVLGRTPRKIYENRFWGDLGFIHLCFDISGMTEMKALCEKNGFPFTVDSSNSFDMGEAAGHFTYIEDPDGTLIEFVETHKIPILKKMGWYLNLRDRNPEKSLPTWMLKALTLNRKKP
jgi:catechol 2,3-dioxygenase-like lactoylglutathione lyase family enzyme